MRALLIGFLGLNGLFAACTTSQLHTPEVAPADAGLPAGATRELEGTIRFQPLTESKSVEAYLGIEFTLESGGEVVVLGPSERVPRAVLEAANGRRVKVSCTMREGAVPSSHESYPMEADGSPMKRPDVCVVGALE
ncbi:MAG TPA: hypothetical protein PK095_07325 [Myxococcota bacterium]|nr:hypothetical protein [Myxococcota bacterium]